jgi:hypothetical protein
VETQDGLYNAFAFWFTWAAAETVLNTATALCFGIPMHFMSDLSSGHVMFNIQVRGACCASLSGLHTYSLLRMCGHAL